MKNVLNYWFKMVQMFIFKRRWIFIFISFLKELINLFLFSFFFIFIFSLSHLSFCFLAWKDTSPCCCNLWTWKMCWVIDSKWCKSRYSKQGVIFYLFFWKINQFKFVFIYFYFYCLSLPSSFLFFSMEVHLYIMVHQMDMKNVLNYWFKMVQILIFKTRCDFFIFSFYLFFIFWKINQFKLFSYFYFNFLFPIFFFVI